jgi:hypothetical protein
MFVARREFEVKPGSEELLEKAYGRAMVGASPVARLPRSCNWWPPISRQLEALVYLVTTN